MHTNIHKDRMFKFATPLGEEELLLTGFFGTEGISRLFSFELTCQSFNHNIPFSQIIGKGVTVALAMADEKLRYFNGIISSFRQGSGGEQRDRETLPTTYSATMVPWAWLLTRTSDLRIFQEKSVPEIVEQIFREKGFFDYSLRLGSTYGKRTYCVQYRETDFNFISRLLEDEGIYYFFVHENGRHTMVLADLPVQHKRCPQQYFAHYQISGGGLLKQEVLTHLEVSQEIRPSKYTLNDYNFTVPNLCLLVEASSTHNLGPGTKEIYDYPAAYDNRGLGDQYTHVRMQEEEAKTTIITGKSNIRSLASGFRFKLVGYSREELNEKFYVLTAIEHHAEEAGYRTGMESQEASYSNSFTCIPYDIPYRPPRQTSKPIVEGVQTAMVVGPAGQEIYTDEYGRVKVQFHWDREGKRNERSSCWMRVSQPSAGAGWGGIDIPRIGHEVIVSFLEGDPDRPIITGRVYHGHNNPPFSLPGNCMVSGMKSNSTPGGGGYNEIALHDTKGSELLNIHAQHDMSTMVLNDQTITVNNNRTKTVAVDQSESVGNNKTIQVGANHSEQIAANKTVKVGANQSEKIGANMSQTIGTNMSVKVGKSKTETVSVASAETVGAGKALTVGGGYQISVGGMMNTTVGLVQVEEIGLMKNISVGKKFQILCGSSKFEMDSGGNILIEGKEITFKASGPMKLEGEKIDLN